MADSSGQGQPGSRSPKGKQALSVIKNYDPALHDYSSCATDPRDRSPVLAADPSHAPEEQQGMDVTTLNATPATEAPQTSIPPNMGSSRLEPVAEDKDEGAEWEDVDISGEGTKANLPEEIQVPEQSPPEPLRNKDVMKLIESLKVLCETAAGEQTNSDFSKLYQHALNLQGESNSLRRLLEQHVEDVGKSEEVFNKRSEPWESTKGAGDMGSKKWNHEDEVKRAEENEKELGLNQQSNKNPKSEEMADQQKSDTHDPDPTGNKLADDSIDASGQGERVNDTKGSDNDLLNAIEKWTGEKEGENRQLLEYIVQFVAGQHNLEENLTRLIPLSMVSWTGHGSKADDNVSDHLDVHQWRESYDSDTTGALEDIRKRVNIKSIKRRLKRSAVEGLVYNKLGYSPYVPGMSGTIQTMGLHKPAIARRTLMQDILEPDEWKDKDSDEMDTHSCSSDSSQGRGGTPEYNYKPLKPDSNEEVGRFNRYIKKPREKLTWLYDLRPRPNFDPGEYEIAEEDLIDDWPSLCPNWPAGFLRDERRVEEEEDKNCEQIRKKRKNRRLLRHDDVMLDASLFAAQYDSESLGTDDSSSTYSATAPKSDTDVEMSQSTEGSVISMDTETDPEVCPEECPEEGAEEGAEEVPEEVPEEGAEEGADGQRDEIQDPAASIDIDTGDSGDSGEEIPQWPKSFFSPFTEVVWVPRNPATPRAQQLTRSFRRIVDSDGIDIAPSVQLARKRKAKARPPYRTDIYVTMNSMNKNVLFLTNAAKNNVQERRRCYLDNSEPATPVTVLAAMTVQWWLFIVLLILGLLLWFWRADGLPLTGYR